MKFIEHILEPQRLLLVWQGSEGSSRSRRAIAELIRQADGPVQLRYLTDTEELKAAQAEGFICFPAFRKLEQSYDLGVVDTFMRRLPPRSRGDYAQYLEQFRLRPEMQISDFALLAYTGAKLPSDGFSIVNPLENITTDADVLIEVAGFRHHANLDSKVIRPGESARFLGEPDNPHDPNAVAILVRDQKIGYVPRQQTLAVRQLATAGAIEACVERVNGRPDRPLVYLFATLRPSIAAEAEESGVSYRVR